MNQKLRVKTALAHRPPDQVPIGEFGIDYDMVERVIGRPTYWRSRNRAIKAFWDGKRDEVVESLKEDVVDLVKELDYDLIPVHLVPPKSFPPQKIKTLGEGNYEDSYGQKWGYSAGNDSLLLLERPRREMTSEDDIIRVFESEIAGRMGFRIAGRDESGYSLELIDDSCLELVRHVVSKFGKDRFIVARGFEEGAGSPAPLYFSEFECASLFFGGAFEDFCVALAWQPRLVEKAFELCTEINLAMAREFIREGVDAIMPAGDFAASSGPMISPSSIRRVFFPGVKKLVDYAHGRGVYAFTHNCGNNWLILAILIEAGFDAWQSIQAKTGQMDLGRLKERYGGRLTFWGGINVETLQDGSPDEIEEEVRRALHQAAPGGGFIAGASNSVAFGSSYDCYMRALETVRRYGKYPIG
jgi:uroporphyrinogen decarboxylase